MVKRSRRKMMKDTQSQKRRKKRTQHYAGGFVPPHIALGREGILWDHSKTLKQNYATLGLAADVNRAVESKEAKSGTLTHELLEIEALPPKEAYEVKSMNLKEQRLLQRLKSKYGDNFKVLYCNCSVCVVRSFAHELCVR